MTSLIRLLTTLPVLVLSLVLMILIGISFAQVQSLIGGPLLDVIVSGDAARERLSEMSASERQLHFWATVTLDTVYPLAYGALLAGLALRFAGSQGPLAAMPALLTVVTDLFENLTQALALQGLPQLIGLKTLLTPAKFALFITAALIGAGLMLSAGLRDILRQRRL